MNSIPWCRSVLCFLLLGVLPILAADEPADSGSAGSSQRGSLIEDRAARKLLEAGDARYDTDEVAKAIEIWQSVIERYPRSKVRLDAHLRLGNHLLQRERAYDRARSHFEAVASEENKDQEQRALATLNMGICFYEARNFGKCFKVMRDVISGFPASVQVNRAYYYIGLAHFQLGHYSRAITALERVGTAQSGENRTAEKVEAGKRLFVKIEDADLAALPTDQAVKVQCETTQGDRETVDCLLVGHNVRVALGSIVTTLGKPAPGDGVLQVRGNDDVKVTYVDGHTADQQFDRPVNKTILVVGDALVDITDGAFSESLRGVVLGKPVNLQITDADLDLTDAADSLEAVVEVYREKTTSEIEAEQANLAKAADGEAGRSVAIDAESGQPKVDAFKKIDQLKLTLREVKLAPTTIRPDKPNNDVGDDTPAAGDRPAAPAGEKPAAAPVPATPATDAVGSQPASSPNGQPAEDNSVHSGVFRATVALVKSEEVIEGDDVLQALPNDQIRLTYVDKRRSSDDPATVVAAARAVEGNLGGVRVTRAQISDQELRIQTQLKTASALTNIGNRYKEFGLKKNAEAKYSQALKVCEEISQDAMKLGGRLLEETYVQLWHIYYEMDQLELAAAMCQRLQREFPNSGFVDDALLQLAGVVRKQGDVRRAIGIYSRLVDMKTSQLRGEAQFGIAECYEEMAKQTTGPSATQLFDRSFQEYKKVFDSFPDSGRVGEAVAKMANYYYQQKDYNRAIDIFENVLADHPDAKFLDVILFNYARCLYRLDRKADARKQFDQLIADFPESPLAADAKRISEALAKAPAAR